MKGRTRLVSVALFLTALVAAVFLVGASLTESRQKPKASQAATGWTGIFQRFGPDQSGKLQPWAVTVRYQSIKGDWRSDTMLIRSGKLVPSNNGTIVSSLERGGQLRIGKEAHAYLGPPLNLLSVDEQWLRNSPGFAGEGEEILGYKTVLLKNPEQGLTWHIAPRLGIVPIRTESEFGIMEPLQIVEGEPPAEIFSIPEVAEIDTEGYQSLIESASKDASQFYQNALDMFLGTEEERQRNAMPPKSIQ